MSDENHQNEDNDSQFEVHQSNQQKSEQNQDKKSRSFNKDQDEEVKLTIEQIEHNKQEQQMVTQTGFLETDYDLLIQSNQLNIKSKLTNRSEKVSLNLNIFNIPSIGNQENKQENCIGKNIEISNIQDISPSNHKETQQIGRDSTTNSIAILQNSKTPKQASTFWNKVQKNFKKESTNSKLSELQLQVQQSLRQNLEERLENKKILEPIDQKDIDQLETKENTQDNYEHYFENQIKQKLGQAMLKNLQKYVQQDIQYNQNQSEVQTINNFSNNQESVGDYIEKIRRDNTNRKLLRRNKSKKKKQFEDQIISKQISQIYDKKSRRRHQFKIIDLKRDIAKTYIQSWFFVDLLTIVPFDYILESGSYNRLGRILRLGKIYRMIKMIRLARLVKVVKYKSLFQQVLHRMFQLSVGIFIAKLEDNQRTTWIFKSGFEDYGNAELYMTSFYYTVTTIVTVGYGDIHAYTVSEKILSITLMIIGVVSFSYASGTLTNIINNQDATCAELKQKIETLSEIEQKYQIKPELIKEIRKWIKYYYSKTSYDVSTFMNELPSKLKTELALETNHKLYTSIEFMKRQDKKFIIWILPLLKPFYVQQNEYIYKEGDEIQEIYFIEKGEAGFVLQRFNNAIYIDIEGGDHFGHLDLVYDPKILNIQIKVKQNTVNGKDLFRRFTIQAVKNCDLHLLSLDNIDKIKIEFPEVFDDLFNNSVKMLQKILKLKIDAIKQCELASDMQGHNSNVNSNALQRLQSKISAETASNNNQSTKELDKNIKLQNNEQRESQFAATLKQIQEEVEDIDESDEDKISSISSQIEQNSVKISVSNFDEPELIKKDHKAIKEKSTAQQSEDQKDFEEYNCFNDKQVIRNVKKRISDLFAKHQPDKLKNESKIDKKLLIQDKNTEKLNNRVNQLETSVRELLGKVDKVYDVLIQIRDNQTKFV
ncbi:cation channel family protein [Stylonychia lemnae]|uniref:Cation channel family protein n=1 Tax=Stylonychia lemnae TaxID=5949 RepID=A0A078ACW7_STYLE|nr:cation channel family protein [Stylonychia lemnae]|eukprot:CDW80054.1 cation channel family protein [Stylonychia lemnae]